MRKSPDAPPRIYVDGERLEPVAGLLRWIEERSARWPKTLFKLPFTFEPGATKRAVLGLSAEGARPYHLDDSALGISLADRLRRAFRDDEDGRRAIWLSVRMGSTLDLAGPGEDTSVASVFVVHEPVGADIEGSRARAQADRDPEGLAVRLLGHGHCARGSKRCKKCEAAAAEPATPALLDLRPDHEQAARPTIGTLRDGAEVWAPYDVLRRFDSSDEAARFAERHAVRDVRLDVPEA